MMVLLLGERSYLVKISNGQIYRRNRKYIRSTNEVTGPEDIPGVGEDAEDELRVPTTEEQIEPTNQTNTPNEQETNATLARNTLENSTSETTTRTGQLS